MTLRNSIRYQSNEKAKAIADCSENQLTLHELSEENHERQVEIRVQDLLKLLDDIPLGKVRPCDIQKLVNSLKLRNACGLVGIPEECLRHLPRRPLVHLIHLFNHCLGLSHFRSSWNEGKVITLPKLGKDLKFPQNLRPISLLATKDKLFNKVILKIVQRHIKEKGLLNAS
jgi:hypothetical protein